MKSNNVVGGHYHKKKDEIFFLIQGTANKVIIGTDEQVNINAPFKWKVSSNVYHLFDLQKGSILLCASTTAFDPNDDFAGPPRS